MQVKLKRLLASLVLALFSLFSIILENGIVSNAIPGSLIVGNLSTFHFLSYTASADFIVPQVLSAMFYVTMILAVLVFPFSGNGDEEAEIDQ